MTPGHVLPDDRPFDVMLADGQRIPGRVRARAPEADLAIVQVDLVGLQPALFATGVPRVGELAVALGAPLGL